MRTTPPIYKYAGMIAGFGLAALLIGFVILLALDANIRLAGWIILALGVLLLITAAVIDFRRVRGAVTGRRGKFSAGNTVMVSVFVGIIVIINAIGINYSAQFDITELSQFTLTTQTKDILEELDTPVEVKCFFIPNDQYGVGQYATSLLEEYSSYTDHLDVEVIDPDKHPDVANEYGITEYFTIVFESANGTRSVSYSEIFSQAEHSFTSAILEVTGQVQKTVYFLSGHGEAEVSGEYAYAAQLLLNFLYKVKTLDLMQEQRIPDDCSALIIPGPRSDLTALESTILDNYLKDNGTVLLLINPNFPDSIRTLLSEWYLTVENGTIIDEGTFLGTNDNPIIPRTQNEFGYTEIYFPGAAALTPDENTPDDILIAPLFYTSAASWVETSYDPTEDSKFNESIEELGSRAIGVLITEAVDEDNPEAEVTQMIVVGDSDFASNQHIANAYNAHQFLACVEYLTQGEQLVTIERKVLPYRQLIITNDEKTFITIISVALLPLLILIVGAVIWWRRR